MDIEVVAEGLQFPEGPVALGDGSVIVCEIRAGRLTRVAPDGVKEILAEPGGGPNGAAIGPDGAVWVANNGGSFEYVERDGLTFSGRAAPGHQGGMIQRIDPRSGKVDTVYEACDGQRLIAPNDLVFDRQGGFWFTDHGADLPDVRRYGALYYARTDGSLISRQRARMISPNGVGLSPDETVVYMADTHLCRVWAFDLEAPGKVASTQGLGPGRVLANLAGYQPVDSLAVEADGHVCVATVRNGGITAVAPDGASEHFPFPDTLITNICFGGPDMRTAWVTGSSTGRLFKARWPRPGLRPNFSLRSSAAPS